MKCIVKVFVGLFIFLVAVQVAFAQIEQGDKEFSIAASFMSRKVEDGESWTVLNIPIRIGYFVTKNVEIEPEILFTSWEDEDLGYVLSGNLAYNVILADQESKTVPFLFSGVGFSNTITYLPNFAWLGAEDETWTVLNVGGGIKFFLQKRAALRFEYRFQKFSGDWDYTYHNMLLGVSAFLNN
jgi:hypothetical protein